ncbi:hypothetical protein [Paenibacillus donghaensis]|uniref:Uncharacterized protein n=1 Tax=Paenibacillus donghaensis TaxID=414771 RepID=A0A2Z2KRG5_9BACL|nr:hypothetical protein [Paenibacillus donghaensis]ASA25409.1 hypothetical protein B9T62_34555 [Paenibacillus donghaensis]
MSTPEREIKVTLLDGSEVLMNTGDRVLFQASRPGAIPLAVEADTIMDDMLLALEDAHNQLGVMRKSFMFSGSALAEVQQTVEELDIALDLSVEETNKWVTLANSATADNERLRRLLEENKLTDPEERSEKV